MKYKEPTQEQIDEIKALTHQMGLTSNRYSPFIPSVQVDGIFYKIDLTATNKTPEDIINTVAKIMYNEGLRQGKKELQNDIIGCLDIRSLIAEEMDNLSSSVDSKIREEVWSLRTSGNL